MNKVNRLGLSWGTDEASKEDWEILKRYVERKMKDKSLAGWKIEVYLKPKE